MISRCVQYEKKLKEDKHLRNAYELVQTSYSQSLSVSDMASVCDVHESHLSSLFKNRIGISPMQYLMCYRVCVACRYLIDDELPIKEITVRCGFKTTAHFSRVFKQQTGCSPARYRDNERRKRQDRDDFHELKLFAEKAIRNITIQAEGLPAKQINVFLSSSGQLYATGDYRAVGMVLPWEDNHIIKMLTMWENGDIDLPHYDCRMTMYMLNRCNADTLIYVSGNEGYHTVTLSSVTLAPPKYIPPDAQTEYQKLLAEVQEYGNNPKSSDWINDLLRRVARLFEDHIEYVSEHKRYMAFYELLLLSVENHSFFYPFLYGMIQCAQYAGDDDMLVKVYSALATTDHPIHLMLMEGAVHALSNKGAFDQATRMNSILEERKKSQAAIRTRRYASDTVDVVFEISTKNSMLAEEERNPGTFPFVCCLDGGLDFGPIDSRFGDGRRLEHFRWLCGGMADEINADYERDLATLVRFTEIGKSIRVWYHNSEPHNACGMAFLCDMLRDIDCEISVVSPSAQDIGFWAIAGCQLPLYISKEKPLPLHEKQYYSDVWRKLKEENASIRTVVDGQLQSAAEDYYDADMLRCMPDDREFVLAEVIGVVAHKLNISTDWIAWRLRLLAEKGKIIIVNRNDDKCSNWIVRRSI